MRAAAEIFLVEIAFAQECRGSRDMDRLTTVRRAGDGDLLAGEVVFLVAAVLEKGKGLKWFGGRSNARDEGRIAGECQQAAQRIDDSDRAAVERFEMVAAVDVGETHRVRSL